LDLRFDQPFVLDVEGFGLLREQNIVSGVRTSHFVEEGLSAAPVIVPNAVPLGEGSGAMVEVLDSFGHD